MRTASSILTIGLVTAVISFGATVSAYGFNGCARYCGGCNNLPTIAGCFRCCNSPSDGCSAACVDACDGWVPCTCS